MSTDKLLVFACGFGCVFLGDLLYGRLLAKKGRPTNFQRFLLATGLVYVVTAAAELVKFFLDYYTPGLALQGFRLTPDLSGLFFRVFGEGVGDPRRYPVFEIDLNFLSMVLGGAAGGAVLLAVLEIKARRTGSGAGVFAGYRPQWLAPGAYIRREYEAFSAAVSYPEYATWWAVRIAMVCALVHYMKNNPYDMTAFQMTVNLCLTFIVPVVRLLFFNKLFFGRLPFRVQTWINVFVFAGSFLGHGCGLNFSMHDFDKLLHVVSGGLCVFIGYALLRNTRESARLSRGTFLFGSVGFSFVVMIVWELFEFFADHYIPDSFNQNYCYDPAPDMLFFRIFGRGAENPGQVPVLDTNIDLICAVAGCAVCAAILWAVLRRKARAADPVCEKERAALQT